MERSICGKYGVTLVQSDTLARIDTLVQSDTLARSGTLAWSVTLVESDTLARKLFCTFF